MRLSACAHTTLCRAVDDARGHLLAPVGGQAVQEDRVRRGRGHEASSTVKPSKARARASASASWPIEDHTSV